MIPNTSSSQNSCETKISDSWLIWGMRRALRELRAGRRVEDDHRDCEGDEPEQLGGGEADEQPALLAVGGRRVAKRALEERAEDVADADRRSADADRGEPGSDHLCGSKVHVETPFLETLVKVDRVVEVERRQKREHIGLDGADQQLERGHENDEQEAQCADAEAHR